MRKYRIRDLRENKNLPQKVVADVLGLSQQQYSRVENEEAEVTCLLYTSDAADEL